MKLRRSVRLLLAGPALALALAGCAGSDSVAGGEPVTPPTTSAPSSTDSPVASAEPTVASSAPSRELPSDAASVRAAGFPPAIDPVEGQQHWAAIVVAGDGKETKFEQATQRLQSVGYNPGDYGVGTCVEGGAKVAGIPGPDSGNTYVTVTFADEAAARAFAKAYQAKFQTEVAGVGQVKEFCLH